jgi:hypothetical protein
LGNPALLLDPTFLIPSRISRSTKRYRFFTKGGVILALGHYRNFYAVLQSVEILLQNSANLRKVMHMTCDRNAERPQRYARLRKRTQQLSCRFKIRVFIPVRSVFGSVDPFT